ncbi:hypothetical protein HBHAL_2113 [Halobacillus halophilus DSM 2266]|uniref:Uncharacterized protein n=1 Tax=Halobacillus halophilus (strain ATCC 35676 / DSM 2266 / JCM 20832 / KCTC 3685 / LMG 17431 / NBRC 102448 / NCIMB 2269) TaxID=866895 RepID=I0JK00_HALH3|nr:hypothetical protein HBHAL_2113 [Halobacillus halophilus DSM 2266]
MGEGSRGDPTGSETTEEAHQFPHRKASYFPTNPYPSIVTDPFISKSSLQQTGALLELNMEIYQSQVKRKRVLPNSGGTLFMLAVS